MIDSILNVFGTENWKLFETWALAIGWQLLEATLIILAGRLAYRFLISRIIGAMERVNFPDATVRGVVRLLLRWGTILVTAYYVMLAIGVQTTAIVGVVTGSALAIGLAMQGTLSNVASGMMLLILRPISVGDYIAGGGHNGTVVTIGIFYTTVDTLENYRISIPNSALFGSAIINYSANKTLTARMMIDVAYDSDLDKAKDLLIKSTKAVKGVLKNPAPQVWVQELGASAVQLEVRFSAKQSEFWPATREARQSAKAILDANGIEIPFPQTTVHYRPEKQEKPENQTTDAGS